MENIEEVFLDAEEDLTPRRSTRKRRSTAGSCSTVKKLKAGMPTERSPGQQPRKGNGTSSSSQAGAAAEAVPGKTNHPPGGDGQDLLAKMQQMMGGMLGGLESRLSKANDELQATVTGQIGQAMSSIDDLTERMTSTEKRLDKVEGMVEKGIACLLYTSPSPRDRQKSRMPSSA